jgi:hypothetical protein
MEMPVTENIYRVLYENLDCRQAAAELMGADNRHELSGQQWQLFSLFLREKDSPAG